MAKKRTRTRVSSKIDELPEALRVKVDVMLADTSNTYEYISQYLKQEGYEISKSSVGRYAMRSNTATQRLLEAQVQTEQLIRVVKDNPDADYTEAAIMLTMNGLVIRWQPQRKSSRRCLWIKQVGSLLRCPEQKYIRTE